MSIEGETTEPEAKKAWIDPEIHEVAIADYTRGGPKATNVENVSYKLLS